MYLEMKGITKTFSSVIANDRVDFFVERGEIHALVGENGAGKTTLMSCLNGELLPDFGQVFLDGKEVELKTPREAINLRIGMVHQRFMLVPGLNVYENVILGSEPVSKFNKIQVETAKRVVGELARRYGFNISLNEKVKNTPVGMQQKVEILKLLYREAEILIFDEPTSLLTPQEIEMLFEIFRRLKNEGKTIIFITHKLEEVMKVADKITVLRKGKVQGVVKKQNTSMEELAYLMVGGEVVSSVKKENPVWDQLVISLKDVSYMDKDGIKRLNDVNLEVHASEILGVVGVEGNGQEELVEIIMGLRRSTAGKIIFMNKDVTLLTTRERRDLGISYIPQDSYTLGSCGQLTIWENLSSTRIHGKEFSRKIFLNFRYIFSFSTALVKVFDIKVSSINTKTKTLSGGNLQKMIVAREFSPGPILIIAEHPTKGLDIRATQYVRDQLLKVREQGKAVLLVSNNLDEILELSDRIIVLFRGKIGGMLSSDDFDKKKIGLLMAGKVEKNG